MPRNRATAVSVLRRNQNEGCEESRLRNQRRRVEGSATRIRVHDGGGCGLKGAVFHKVEPQCLTASQQAVVCVGKRKRRQEGKGLATTVTDAAPDLNPVMMLIVSLLVSGGRGPTMESRSHTGHRRGMPPGQSDAQAGSRLNCRTEESG